MVKIGNDGFAAHEKNGIRHRRTGEATLPASPLFDGMQFNPNTKQHICINSKNKHLTKGDSGGEAAQ